ncbi:hypothetical protein ALMP_55590 [Streptomyces sp. A012304]|nr:hypothetical protein ALMP_55590 [Streptomyces sp. A012304]
MTVRPSACQLFFRPTDPSNAFTKAFFDAQIWCGFVSLPLTTSHANAFVSHPPPQHHWKAHK